MKRCAIQFTGLVRGYRFAEVRNKIETNLLEPIRRAGYEIDVFVSVCDDKEYDGSIHKLNPCKIVLNRDSEIDSEAREYADYFDWPDSPRMRYRSSKIKVITGAFKQLISWRDCARIRIQYEKENNIEYDWVINTSPQMEPQDEIVNLNELDSDFFYCPTPIRFYRRGDSHFGGYYDSFTLGSPEIMNYTCDLYSWITESSHEVAAEAGAKKSVHMESILKEYIDLKYKVKFVRISFNKVRYNGDILRDGSIRVRGNYSEE